MVRKILAEISDEQLQEDLEKYRQRALELGAADARIIPADMVVVDERVRIKCMYPECPAYGKNYHCPPRTIDVDLTRKMVNNFRYALFVKMEVPSEAMTGTGDREKKLRVPFRRRLYEVVGRVEAAAFYDGYYLAVGFGMSGCKSVFCPRSECSALIPGGSCRHPMKARPSMEAVGMDAFVMAARVGWDVYPLGYSSAPADVSCGLLLGLVLIA